MATTMRNEILRILRKDSTSPEGVYYDTLVWRIFGTGISPSWSASPSRRILLDTLDELVEEKLVLVDEGPGGERYWYA